MSPLRTVRLLAPAALVGVALTTAAVGQQAASPTTNGSTQMYGTIFFKSNVGSFKILGVQDTPAEGKLTISFTGTVLIDEKATGDPKVTVSGNLRKEYDSAAHLQQAYHGTGTLVIDGKYKSIQWFGRDMSAEWNGFGIARLVGEFDKDLKTGTYWYGANPDDKHDWGTSMTPITNPGKPGQDYKIIPRGRSMPPVTAAGK